MANNVTWTIYEQIRSLLRAATFETSTNTIRIEDDPSTPNVRRVYQSFDSIKFLGGRKSGINTWILMRLGNMTGNANNPAVFENTNTIHVHMYRQVQDPENVVQYMSEVETEVRQALIGAGYKLGFTGTNQKYCRLWDIIVNREEEQLSAADTTKVRTWDMVIVVQQDDS